MDHDTRSNKLQKFFVTMETALENELPKINSFKSSRDKLLCISSCCTLISNLMLDTSKSNAI
ncbi:VPS9 domain superfamily, partial [Arabidopsis thaliana x Arabidopsis arenosa]